MAFPFNVIHSSGAETKDHSYPFLFGYYYFLHSGGRRVLPGA